MFHKYRHIRFNLCCQVLPAVGDVSYFLLLLLRFNTFVQTNCYDQCCKLFKELAAHELKYDFDVVDQNYVILIQVVLGLPPTAATLHTLTCEQVMEMVMAVAEEFDE